MELPKRKPNRLKEYDYSRNGAYFITICVKDRHELLWCVGDGAIVPMLVSTLKRFVNKEIGFSLFQRSYHDHIIRNEREYEKIRQYIDTNPLKWEDDCFYGQQNNSTTIDQPMARQS